jgi:uncharacterized membrane protein
MDRRLRQVTIALTIIGLLVSIYMTIYKFTNKDIQAAMCVGAHGCTIVNSSPYAEVNGIPVAVVGVFGYLSILALFYLEARPGFFQDNGSMLLFGVTLVGFLFTVWLIYVEIALIKAYCPFCITSQIAMTLIFALTVIRVIKQPYLGGLNAPH